MEPRKGIAITRRDNVNADRMSKAVVVIYVDQAIGTLIRRMAANNAPVTHWEVRRAYVTPTLVNAPASWESRGSIAINVNKAIMDSPSRAAKNAIAVIVRPMCVILILDAVSVHL